MLLGAGSNLLGLDVTLWPEVEESVSHTQSFYGIEVNIHHSEEYPDAKKPVYVQPGYDVKISVVPALLTSELAVRLHFFS